MSHYDVLGLPVTATGAEIRTRYLELVKVVHPDSGGDAFQFQVLADAYAVLSDPVTRRRYDAVLEGEAEEIHADRATRQGRPGRRTATEPGKQPGSSAWSADGCATEIAERLVIGTLLGAVAVGAVLLGLNPRQAQSVGLLAFVVFVVVSLVRRAWRRERGLRRRG